MTVVVPISSGTVADQFVVPAAAPVSPVEVLHFTAVTPTLSAATPVTLRVAAEVETIVNAGEVMVSDGGVASVPGFAGGVGAGGVGDDGGTGAGAGGGVGAGAGGGVGVGVGVGAGAGFGAPDEPLPYRLWMPAISSLVNPLVM